MGKAFPEDYNFVPVTWNLPAEYPFVLHLCAQFFNAMACSQLTISDAQWISQGEIFVGGGGGERGDYVRWFLRKKFDSKAVICRMKTLCA